MNILTPSNEIIVHDWSQAEAGLHITTILKRDGKMVDIDCPERREQAKRIVAAVRGPDVLMAGLGLGVIARELLQLDIHIAIAEKDQEIIDLWISQPIPFGHVRISAIRNMDIFQPFGQFQSSQFNTILFDIWSEFDPLKHVREILTLERLYRPLLKPGGKMLAWVYDDLLDLT